MNAALIDFYYRRGGGGLTFGDTDTLWGSTIITFND